MSKLDVINNIRERVAVQNFSEENKRINKKNIFIKPTIISVSCLILITGVVFAKDHIISYFGLGKGIDKAVENGYIENPDMSYIESDVIADNELTGIVVDNVGASLKIEKFLMDDLNLSVDFSFIFDEAIKQTIDLDNIKNIELKDLIVTDEAKRIIFCLDKEIFEQYCEENNLEYEFGEFNNNYMNNGLNSFIRYHNKEYNQLDLVYNMYADGYPKSKKLNFKFTSIVITENGEEIEKRNKVILKGNWNIDLEVPEKMYNRQTTPYKVVSCSNKDFEITNASASDTGFEIGIVISNMPKPIDPLFEKMKKYYSMVENGEMTEEESYIELNKFANSEEYQEYSWSEGRPIMDIPHSEMYGEKIEDTSYVENEKGEKFEITMSPSRRQNHNFVDGDKFDYYETYGLTKYDATDKIKVQIMFKGSPVIIELEKI